MEQRWAVVTGASGSMGAVAVESLAGQGRPVIMACRNLQKGEAIRQDILSRLPDAIIEVHRLELESFASVRAFAAGIADRSIGWLFNNAGIISRNYSLTADGFEHTMQVNYLAPALLTRLLLHSLTPDAHIVNMVSLTAKLSRLSIDWQQQGEKKFSQLGTYGSTKLAFLYFSIALAQRHPDKYINVSDPGIVNSNMISMHRWFDPLADIFFRPFIKTPQQGVQPAINALETQKRMCYFVGKKQEPIPHKFIISPLVEQLWEQANQLLNLQ